MTPDQKRRYRAEYSYTNDYSPCHMWKIVGARGGLHLHIRDHGEEHGKKYGERYTGGIEIHHRSPPEYMIDHAPSHDECFLLKAPCWHDGSSLQATEHWIPIWLSCNNDHDLMFELLATEADNRFFK